MGSQYALEASPTFFPLFGDAHLSRVRPSPCCQTGILSKMRAQIKQTRLRDSRQKQDNGPLTRHPTMH